MFLFKHNQELFPFLSYSYSRKSVGWEAHLLLSPVRPFGPGREGAAPARTTSAGSVVLAPNSASWTPAWNLTVAYQELQDLFSPSIVQEFLLPWDFSIEFFLTSIRFRLWVSALELDLILSLFLALLACRNSVSMWLQQQDLQFMQGGNIMLTCIFFLFICNENGLCISGDDLGKH